MSLLFIVFSSLHLSAQEVKKIELLGANSMEYDESLGEGIQRLLGDVRLKHEEAIMNCDSAYRNTGENSFIAYGNVHLIQGDSMHLYGDTLYYYGNTKLAEVRNNVRLVNNEGATLTTHFLNYDRNTEVGYYFNRGEINDNENNLKSVTGYYYSETKDFISIDSVVLTNPEYVMYSDTLKYNTASEIAFFFGPTEIVSDSSFIYCENGWYNTITDISQYNKNAYLIKKAQTLKGDSLYYDRKNGFGKAFINVELSDTVEQIVLKGNYAIYREEPEYAFLTDSAQFIQISDDDSLFLHGDTITSEIDTSGEHKIIKAYHKVKTYRHDLQGKCDSLVYSFRDSVIQLHIEPVLWSEENQLTAEYIEIHTVNKKADHVMLQNAAFITSQEDTIRFNQIKGKFIVGYFKNGELNIIYVNGNAQSLYFPKDDEDLVGANKGSSSDMRILMKDGDPHKIYFLKEPDAVLHPVGELLKNELYLQGFNWLDKQRPKDKLDIFRWE